MKKVLITGASGFAGSFLSEYLISKKNYEVYGTYLTDSSLDNLKKIKDEIHPVKIDLTNVDETGKVISEIKPEMVFHLAAFPSPADSFKNPSRTIYNNLAAQINILEAIKNNKLTDTKILIVSSAEIYGLIKYSDLPIDEDTSYKPTSPYAVSKLSQDFLGLQYYISYKLKIIRVRPFNHIGPRLSPSFAASSFARRIAEIEKRGKEAVLYVGNLKAKRDFTDVRDMVRAYQMILENGEIGDVYNIGSGKSYEISFILDKLLSFTDKKIKIQVDPKLLRPNDTPEFRCDNKKIVDVTGWHAEIPIETSLKDTLDYWRNII